MSKQQTQFGLLVTELLLLLVLVVLLPFAITLDIGIFIDGNSEVSVTELSQEALILTSAITFAISALKQPDARAWLVLVAGLFTCMFLREIDFWLDQIAHGFWKYPTTLVAISALAYAARHRNGLKAAALRYAATRSHAYIATGLVIVMFYSRLAGTSQIWIRIMGDAYQPAYKTLVQESLELLGYGLIALGSVTFLIRIWQQSAAARK